MTKQTINKNQINTKRAYQSYETFKNALSMRVKMIWDILTVPLIVYISLLIVTSIITHGWALWGKYFRGLQYAFLAPISGYGMDKSIEFIRAIHSMVFKAFNPWVWVYLPVFILIPFVVKYFDKKAQLHGQKVYHRGARGIEPAELMDTIRSDGKKTSLPIGEITLPVDAETKHALVIGAPGTGKTICLSAIIKEAMDRGERGIIYDTKGDFIPRFYDPSRGDLILNPRDTRCVNWTIFNDIESEDDIATIGRAVVPDSLGNDPYWSNAGRDIIKGILHAISRSKNPTNRDIWDILRLPTEDIYLELKNTPGGEIGAKHIEMPGSKQAASVMSVLMSNAEAFRALANIDGDFSLRQWFDNGTGWIFLPSYPNIRETVRPILSLFITLAGINLLSLPDDRKRRIFFFLDEIGTLHKIPIIENFLTQSRSKGGSVWIGTQDKAQIERIYGRETRETMINSCGNMILFT